VWQRKEFLVSCFWFSRLILLFERETRNQKQVLMPSRRIGAYGGTFDPVHNGHMEVVRAVVRDFGLDQLLIIPAHRPPHKGLREIAGDYHRFTMTVLASLDEPRVRVSTMELETPDRPYTFETVESLQSMFGKDTSLFFVMGADSFEEINTWREPARLLTSTNLIVITRPGYDVGVSHLDERFSSRVVDLRGREGETSTSEDTNEHRIYMTGCANIGISSTEIRQRVRDRESIRELVPARVADYISKYELYR